MLKVTQFMRFVSLDGVDWNDPYKTEKLYVGRAILDFMELTKDASNPVMKPVKRDTVPRVVGSAALSMHDQNLIVLPKPLADEGTPIIINNACTSWHRLAKNFTFGNARAYIGTLFPVTPSEAQEVVIELLDKHFGKTCRCLMVCSVRNIWQRVATTLHRHRRLSAVPARHTTRCDRPHRLTACSNTCGIEKPPYQS